MNEPVAVVYMDWGRWVAKCPRPGCGSAEAFGPGLDGQRFWCRPGQDGDLGGCGFRCAAQWPAEIALIEQLLQGRPMPSTRNWKPGETVHDLLHENVLHGILPDGPLRLTDSTMLALPGR